MRGVYVRLLDGTRVLAAARTTDEITGTGTSTVSLTIGEIGPVTYWSPENPKLYTVKTTLSCGRPGGQGGGRHRDLQREEGRRETAQQIKRRLLPGRKGPNGCR